MDELSATDAKQGTMSRTLEDMRRIVTAATLVVLVLLAHVQLAPQAAAATLPTAEAEFLCSVNAEREKAGLPGLRVVAELTSTARAHSARMADASRLYHNPNLSSEVSNWRVLAENVGRGQSVVSRHQAFMGSRGHRANILNTSVTEVGIGVEARGSTLWVTQVFRQPARGASGHLPTCGTTAVSGAASADGAIPVRGDWNGDGFETPGWFDNGRWRLSNGLDGTIDVAVGYGRAGDLPVVGDWNGSGRDAIGVVRDDTWHLRDELSGGPAHRSFRYGRITRGDIPIVGDWNASGRDTIGIIRDGEWHLRNSLSGGPGQTVFTYGRVTRGDIPVAGDWNGSGQTGIGIVRSSQWHLRDSLSGGAADRTVLLQ
jgi:uncharacterized protein YkwD